MLQIKLETDILQNIKLSLFTLNINKRENF